MKKRYIFLAILVLIAGGVIYLSTYNIDTITVTGCENINEATIKEAVKQKSVLNNTLLTSIKIKFSPISDVPFLTKADVEVGEKNELLVTVYEKKLAGCVEYMNYYVYIDKDGVVMESSEQKVDGVPSIKGLEFEKWEMGEKLPISDEQKFQSIISITQLIEKYGLSIDSIKFTPENEIVLTHEGITIELGEGEYLAIQMMNLGSILEGLEGKEGTLYMKDFNSENATASFSKK